jgi:hypothetical protein
MITLKANLHDKLLFMLLDLEKLPKEQCHELARSLAPELSEWMQDYFAWFIKGHSRNMKGDIRKEFDFFRKMVKRRVGEDGQIKEEEESE